MGENQLDKYRDLLDAYETGRLRRREHLKLLLRQQNHQHAVLVMMVNLGHFELFRNWVRSCDDRSIDVRSWSLIFTVDSEAANGVEQLGFTSFTDRNSYGAQPKEAVKAFGDRQFRLLMFQKTAIVKDVLDLGYSLLFQDVDVVWLKDPRPFFLKPSHQRFDARFMYDGPNKMHAPLHLNSGFFWLKNTRKSISFWTDVLMHCDLIFTSGSQQKVVNQIIVGHLFKGLKLHVLREDDFANGHLFSINSAANLPKDPYVIHCSWTGNIQHKLEKFKLAGLWHLDS